MSRNSMKKQKRKYNTFRIIAAVVFITFIAIGALYGAQKYSNPTLQGRWRSVDTGDIVEFTQEGTVSLKGVTYTPEYQIVGPNQLTYIVEDKQFDMEYILEGRMLKWGMMGQELEEFKRE